MDGAECDSLTVVRLLFTYEKLSAAPACRERLCFQREVKLCTYSDGSAEWPRRSGEISLCGQGSGLQPCYSS
ncbi:hypothetical protein scyTo_0004061 [Scyliorhinus torazame]|uniref:Uncharacterized protein n=1 Tax=Scyliorhinus torazame TaxID=75743 RepID=A0A401NJZ7_SCYTO|nr:hypothetical protein [Scyliorhinus torazame]